MTAFVQNMAAEIALIIPEIVHDNFVAIAARATGWRLP